MKKDFGKNFRNNQQKKDNSVLEMYDFISHIELFLVAAMFIEVLAVYAWHFRSILGAVPYSIHKAAISLLLLAMVMASLASEIKVKIFWIMVQYTGIFVAVLAWLAVAFEMTGRKKYLTQRMMIVGIVVLGIALSILGFPAYFGVVFGWKARICA